MNVYKSEYILPYYMWGFIFYKPLFIYINSTYLLAGHFIVCLLIFVLNNYKVFFKSTFFIILFFSIYYFLDVFLFHKNEVGVRYYNEFIFRGFIPFIMSSTLIDFHKFLKNYSILGVLCFLLVGTDAINGYVYFDDYMTFGFNLVLPAFFSILLLLIKFPNIWLKIILFPLLIFALYNAVVFSNRSVILSVFLFILFYIFKIQNNKFYKVLILLPLLILFNIEILLGLLIDFTKENGINSYALEQYRIFFIESGSADTLFSGRFEIWENAVNLMADSLIFGNGIGAFEEIYGIYTHNFFLDIFIFNGIILGLYIIYIVYRSSLNLYNRDKLFWALIFFSTFPKLLFSTYYLNEPFFWILISFFFHNKDLNFENGKK